MRGANNEIDWAYCSITAEIVTVREVILVGKKIAELFKTRQNFFPPNLDFSLILQN